MQAQVPGMGQLFTAAILSGVILIYCLQVVILYVVQTFSTHHIFEKIAKRSLSRLYNGHQIIPGYGPSTVISLGTYLAVSMPIS